MRTLTLSMLFAVIAVVGLFLRAEAAPVPKHLMKDENPNLAALQGKWELCGAHYQGKPVPLEDVKRAIEFQGDQATFRIGDAQGGSVATVKLDLDANPRRMIFTFEPPKGLDGKPLGRVRTTARIFTIEQGELVTAGFLTGNNEKTPSDFGTDPDSDSMVMIYKKITK